MTHLIDSKEPFPDWLPKSAHHSVYGCYKCQDVCPENQTLFSNITEKVCFSGEETEILLAGIKKDEMPVVLLDKIERLGVEDWRLGNFPKNLREILDSTH